MSPRGGFHTFTPSKDFSILSNSRCPKCKNNDEVVPIIPNNVHNMNLAPFFVYKQEQGLSSHGYPKTMVNKNSLTDTK
jgi:hypothetical protein